MGDTELSVVCRNCGSEASPYVTECPYCGARLRKRAPKLERRGDGFEAKEPRRKRRRPKPDRSGTARSRLDAFSDARPVATIAVIAISALMAVVYAASGQGLADLGAIVGPVDGELWRYVAAPFAYDDTGYVFVVGIALAIFGTGLERRLGIVPTLLLLIACGALGMLAAGGIETATDGFMIAAGGNGIALGAIAAWFVVRRAEADGDLDEAMDVIGVAVSAAVVLALPIFEDTANVYAGLAGGLVGALAGFAAARLRSRA